MTLDLHFLGEVREDTDWSSVHHWVWYGPDLMPKRPLYRMRPDTRILPLFAALGGPCKLALAPERDVVSSTSGFPEDLHDKTQAYVEQFDVIEPQHTTLDALAAYPWYKPIKRFYRVSPRAFEHYKTTGIVPIWAHEENDELRTEEILDVIEPLNLWGKEWLNHTIPRVDSHQDKNSRYIYFFTEGP